MKKQGVLNHRLAAVIAQMGHTDTLVVADAGLPVPPDVERIDLAVSAGVPPLLSVLEAIASELTVESIVAAEELNAANAPLMAEIAAMFPGVPIVTMPHEHFKLATQQARAIVRTGECTPYANVILRSGVAF